MERSMDRRLVFKYLRQIYVTYRYAGRVIIPWTGRAFYLK